MFVAADVAKAELAISIVSAIERFTVANDHRGARTPPMQRQRLSLCLVLGECRSVRKATHRESAIMVKMWSR
jgi:hypothetical protein